MVNLTRVRSLASLRGEEGAVDEFSAELILCRLVVLRSCLLGFCFLVDHYFQGVLLLLFSYKYSSISIYCSPYQVLL